MSCSSAWYCGSNDLQNADHAFARHNFKPKYKTCFCQHDREGVESIGKDGVADPPALHDAVELLEVAIVESHGSLAPHYRVRVVVPVLQQKLS